MAIVLVALLSTVQRLAMADLSRRDAVRHRR